MSLIDRVWDWITGGGQPPPDVPGDGGDFDDYFDDDDEEGDDWGSDDEGDEEGDEYNPFGQDDEYLGPGRLEYDVPEDMEFRRFFGSYEEAYDYGSDVACDWLIVECDDGGYEVYVDDESERVGS